MESGGADGKREPNTELGWFGFGFFPTVYPKNPWRKGLEVVPAFLCPIVQKGERSGGALWDSEINPKGAPNWVQQLSMKFYTVFWCRAIQT